MNNRSARETTLLDNYLLMFCLVIVIQLIFAVTSIEPEIFEKNYPDGPMRLLSVDDLLGGQPWFDTVQHRVLPPQGLDLHWSRLIDGAIAALILFFGVFMTPEMARTAAIVAWPMLLLVGYIAIIGHVAKVRFGAKCATFTIFAGAFSPYTYGTFFSPGALDHHNVQVVCIVAVFWALTGREDYAKHGFIGGLATAISLAVGLETLPFITLVMLILLTRFVRGTAGMGTLMRSFGISLGVAAPILFLLQTDPAQWYVMYCDELAPPVLAATSAAAFLGLVLPRLASVTHSLGYRLGVTLAMITATVLALSPALQPCLASPYSNVPLEVRQNVIAHNTENYSVLAYFLNAPVQGISYVLPLLILIALLWPTLKHGSSGRDTRLLLLIFCGFALLGAFVQVRLLVTGFALLPLAFGIVAVDFVATQARGLKYLMQVAAVFTLIFTPLVAMAMVAPFRQEISEQSRPLDHNCLAGNTVGPLADLAPAIIFTPLNLGPKVLQYTDHSVTGASYHRSPDALINGMLRFTGTEAAMARAVAATGSSYVIVCRGQIYGTPESIGSRLATGEQVPGLRELSGENDPVKIFEVLPSFTN